MNSVNTQSMFSCEKNYEILLKVSPTGNWDEDFEDEKQNGEIANFEKIFEQDFTLMVALLGSSSNICVPDPWFNNKYQETSSVLTKHKSTQRRKISLYEARKIALSVHAEAEAKRMRFIEEEAKNSIFWENIE